MSDRVKGLTVVFEKEVSEEYAEKIQNAILFFNGVIKVKPIPVKNGDDWIIEQRVRRELGDKLFEVIYPKTK